MSAGFENHLFRWCAWAFWGKSLTHGLYSILIDQTGWRTPVEHLKTTAEYFSQASTPLAIKMTIQKRSCPTPDILVLPLEVVDAVSFSCFPILNNTWQLGIAGSTLRNGASLRCQGALVPTSLGLRRAESTCAHAPASMLSGSTNTGRAWVVEIRCVRRHWINVTTRVAPR